MWICALPRPHSCLFNLQWQHYIDFNFSSCCILTDTFSCKVHRWNPIACSVLVCTTKLAYSIPLSKYALLFKNIRNEEFLTKPSAFILRQENRKQISLKKSCRINNYSSMTDCIFNNIIFVSEDELLKQHFHQRDWRITLYRYKPNYWTQNPSVLKFRAIHYSA